MTGPAGRAAPNPWAASTALRAAGAPIVSTGSTVLMRAMLPRHPRRFRAGRSAETTSTTARRTTAAPASWSAVNRSPTTKTPNATAMTGLT